jgi:hypothetical protein
MKYGTVLPLKRNHLTKKPSKGPAETGIYSGFSKAGQIPFYRNERILAINSMLI